MLIDDISKLFILQWRGKYYHQVPSLKYGNILLPIICTVCRRYGIDNNVVVGSTTVLDLPKILIFMVADLCNLTFSRCNLSENIGRLCLPFKNTFVYIIGLPEGDNTRVRISHHKHSSQSCQT